MKPKNIQIDIFYIIITTLSIILSFKATYDNTYFYYTWYIIGFWIIYSFFYFRNQKINLYLLSNIYTFLGILLSISGIYQFFIGYNFITGFYDNPAGYAITLTCFFPFTLSLYLNSKSNYTKCFYLVSCLLIISSIIISSSRTAIVALLAILFFFGAKKHRYISFFFLILFSISLIFLFKTDSSLGRFFILKTSLSMLNMNNIWFGNGIGTFKKEYMNYQANQLQNSDNISYLQLADNISHPMNEYLLFLIENGILFLFLITIFMVTYFCRVQKNTPYFYCSIAILITSFFSYPFHYPIVLFMLAYNLSVIRWKTIEMPNINSMLKSLLTILFVTWEFYIVRDISINYIWKKQADRCQLGMFLEAKDTYQELLKYMSRNDSFLFNYSSILYNNNMNVESLQYTKMCFLLRNNYDVQLLLADNYFQLKDYKKAVYHYQIASCMCPNRFLPLYGEFLSYRKMNDVYNLRRLGEEILAKEIKVESRTIENIQNSVRDILNECK